MRPYGQTSKIQHKCKGHGSDCPICCPITGRQAIRRGLLDYSYLKVSRGREKRAAQAEIQEQLDEERI